MPELAKWSEELQNAIIDHLIDGVAPGPLDGATLHLYKESVPLTGAMVPADFVEADFTGYSSAAITWATRTRANKKAITKSQLASFVMSAVTVTNTIYGWYVVDTGGTKVLMAFAYGTPKPIAEVGASVDVVVQVEQGGNV